MFKTKLYKFILTTVVVFIIIAFIALPDICSQGVSRGFLICGNVIIPSLFPFMVCVLLLIKSQISINNSFLLKILYLLFGHNSEMFLTFLFSMIGGYPVGCKLLNELCKQNKINAKTANIMQMYCVNAGPAFIITAIGSGVFNSKRIGVILFISHISASVIIAIFTAKHIRQYITESVKTKFNKNFSDNFVLCVSDAAESVTGICGYVILFSVLNSYTAYFFKDFSILKNIGYLIEVTNGLINTNNIFFASFLLGFSGISIWCQIFSLSKIAKVNLNLFILGRLLHGGISSLLAYLLINIFDISKTTFSNNLLSEQKLFYNNITVSLSLCIMVLVLLIYFFSKNNSRKIIDDMV